MTWDAFNEWRLTAPGLSDPGRAVCLTVLNTELHAALSWEIDESGRLNPNTRVQTDHYTQDQDSAHPRLPDPAIIKLGPLPPIVKRANESTPPS